MENRMNYLGEIYIWGMGRFYREMKDILLDMESDGLFHINGYIDEKSNDIFVERPEDVDVTKVNHILVMSRLFCDDIIERGKALYGVADDFFIDGRKYCQYRFVPDFFLPPNSYNMKKIKVVFIYPYNHFWNVIRTVFEAFNEDTRFDTVILLETERYGEAWKIHAKDILMDVGARWIDIRNYSFEKECPDILIVSSMFKFWDFLGENIHQYCKYVSAICCSVTELSKKPREFWDYINEGYGLFLPDSYLVSAMIYEHLLMCTDLPLNKIVKFDSPKFDGIAERCLNKQIPQKWKKLRSCKHILLYAPDHWNGGEYAEIVGNSVDQYLRPLLNWYSTHPQEGLIIRMHKVYVIEMMNDYKLWSDNDWLQIWNYCASSKNIVWDESENYEMALGCCDAILTEMQCGITYSGLVADKPLGALYRLVEDETWYSKLEKAHYKISNREQLIEFLQMIEIDQDPKSNDRKEIIKKFVGLRDGKNGLRIKEYIVKEYEKNEYSNCYK